MKNLHFLNCRSFATMAILVFAICLSACQSGAIEVFDEPLPQLAEIPSGLTAEQAASLASLEQIDDFPLYTMIYYGEHAEVFNSNVSSIYQANPPRSCSLFVSYADPDNVIFGRNFDWGFSPALLLYMDPPNAYASVSMVDIDYLGYEGDGARDLVDQPLDERIGLLDAPLLPFDGINEAGLVVGMAAVPDGGMASDPTKETIDSVMVIRKVLDQAANIEEALEIFGTYNIDMYGNYLHYLIAEESGRSVLVEFSEGEMVVIPNETDWQIATNFLLSETWADSGIHCGRFNSIRDTLQENGGRISSSQAIQLLETVSQPSTQWSALYQLSAGEIWLVMGREYDNIHKIELGFE